MVVFLAILWLYSHNLGPQTFPSTIVFSWWDPAFRSAREPREPPDASTGGGTGGGDPPSPRVERTFTFTNGTITAYLELFGLLSKSQILLDLPPSLLFPHLLEGQIPETFPFVFEGLFLLLREIFEHFKNLAEHVGVNNHVGPF